MSSERSADWWPLLVYGPLGAVGAAAAFMHRGSVFSAPVGPRFSPGERGALGTGLLLALAIALLTLLATRQLVARTCWARALHDTLRLPLLGAPTGLLAALAVSSALAEELFFRAALVPLVGVFASAAVFGALHGPPRGTYTGWRVWSGLMGLTFGALYVGSGSLLAPIVAHALINYGNMRFLCSHDPSAPEPATASLQEEPARRL